MFYAFFCVLYKRMRHSLRSFWFHKSYKNYKSRKKKNVKECIVLFIRLKQNLTFCFQNIFIYIYIYIFIYMSIYIYIYILKKNPTFCGLLQKNETFSHSFAFFAKRNILCVLFHSLQKNVAFFAFFSVLKKRT